jgi:hypothetical protein
MFGEPMPHVGKVSSRLFALPEYERAQFDLFHSAVRHLMKAKNSLYAQIQEGDHSETIPATQNTMPSGETVTSEPIMMESKIVFQWDDIRNCNLDALAEQADNAAEERLSIVMPRLFEMLGKTSEAAGTATDMAGAPLTFESYLAAFSKIELRFEENGEPIMPQLVVHPDTAKMLRSLPRWTADQQKIWDAMIEGKRKEYFASRRHRKLS